MNVVVRIFGNDYFLLLWDMAVICSRIQSILEGSNDKIRSVLNCEHPGKGAVHSVGINQGLSQGR